MGWYSNLTGNCSGRVLHFLYCYGGLKIAEESVIHADKVTYYGKCVGTYKMVSGVEVMCRDGWKFTSNFVPVFEFTPEYQWMSEAQDAKQKSAILESMVHEIRKRIDDVRHEMHKPRLVMSIWESSPDRPEYLVAKKEFEDLAYHSKDIEHELAIAEQHINEYVYC